MRRLPNLLTLILIASVVLPAAAQIQEECMDCYEKETQTPQGDGTYRSDYEAACCDAPCIYPNGFAVKEADVGFGCMTAELTPEINEATNRYGRVCNSSDADLGCPEDDPPPEDTPGGGNLNPGGAEPILLDLGEHNYRLTSLPDGVQFDLRNEGVRRQIAWTRAHVENAFLAVDRNGNGRIDNGSELFGNYTPLRSGTIARNGFEALAEFDGNHDGVVDERDADWSRLLLWTDRNHDGWSTADELQPIAQSIVSALETEYRVIGRKDQWGNLFYFRSKFRIRHNGQEQQRTYYDVYLRMAM